MSHKTVLSLSGGLDSGVLLAELIKEGYEVFPISFDYGQRHASKEIVAARNLAASFGLSNHRIIDLRRFFEDLASTSTSTLLNTSLDMPHQTYKELEESKGPSPTYVPYRNGLFISIVTSIALQLGIENVHIATHAEDARNWAYPDCTPEFNGPQGAAVYIGTYMKVRLHTPFQWMMKKDIVALGLKINAPMKMMWSCYEGGDKPCGKCPTCIERIEAFRLNKVADPVEYQ